MPPSNEVTLLTDTEDLRLGALGPLLITVWYGELTIPAIEALDRHHQRLAKEHGHITMLSVVVRASKAPPPEVRAKMESMRNGQERVRRGNIVVVEGKGLSTIIARTFLAALSLVTKDQMKVVGSLEDGVAAVRSLPEQDAMLRDRVGLVEELRQFVVRPPPAAVPAAR